MAVGVDDVRREPLAEEVAAAAVALV